MSSCGCSVWEALLLFTSFVSDVSLKQKIYADFQSTAVGCYFNSNWLY